MSQNHTAGNILEIFTKIVSSLGDINQLMIHYVLSVGTHSTENSLTKRGSFSKMKKRKKSTNRDQSAPRQPLSGKFMKLWAFIFIIPIIESKLDR